MYQRALHTVPNYPGHFECGSRDMDETDLVFLLESIVHKRKIQVFLHLLVFLYARVGLDRSIGDDLDFGDDRVLLVPCHGECSLALLCVHCVVRERDGSSTWFAAVESAMGRVHVHYMRSATLGSKLAFERKNRRLTNQSNLPYLLSGNTMSVSPFTAAHRFYVKSLYKRYLVNALNWNVRRDTWRQQALEIRAEFERNR
jgi:hypothetical protein